VMQKTGELEEEPGRRLIVERLQDGGRTVAAFYASAWQASAITEDDVKAFIRFDSWGDVKDMKPSPPLPRGAAPAGQNRSGSPSKPQ
ncbi:MAG TPA: hypothetical protein VIL95_01035, partial [Bacillota bacterium]